MEGRLKDLAFTWLKDLAYVTRQQPLLFYQYAYMFTPAQLAYLCSCIDEVAEIPGSILEVGCAYGYTTVFLNRHMDASGIEKPYVCIDTFSGFTQSDIVYERKHRAKTSPYDAFKTNKKRWFERTLAINDIKRVRTYQADAAAFDYAQVGPIALCLIDVDLYQPVAAALPKVWSQVQPGGIVVVDDCAPDQQFDGAYEAYLKFAPETDPKRDEVLGKLGVLRKT